MCEADKWGDVVVFFMNGIGDCILNMPALRGLAEFLGDRMSLIVPQHPVSAVFIQLPVRKLINVEFVWEERDSGRERIFSVERILDQIERCDTFIALVPWKSGLLQDLVVALGAKRSIGYFQEYDIAIPLDYGKHSAYLAFDCVRLLSDHSSFEEFGFPVVYPDPVITKSRYIRSALPPDAKVLAVHADTLECKMWPRLRLLEVLDVFLSRYEQFWALIVGIRRYDLSVCQRYERIVSCVGIGLLEAMALVSEADQFLGVDSCMLHVADIHRIPTVALFGPTSAKEFGCLFTDNITIQSASSMDAIDVTRVCRALDEITQSPNQRQLWLV